MGVYSFYGNSFPFFLGVVFGCFSGSALEASGAANGSGEEASKREGESETVTKGREKKKHEKAKGDEQRGNRTKEILGRARLKSQRKAEEQSRRDPSKF